MEDYLLLLADAGVIICPKELNGLLSLQSSCGVVLLHVAALSGSINNIELLLKIGLPIDAKSHGFTPLSRAVSCGQSESVEFLIKKGANKDIKTTTGGSLLHLAASAGQIESAKILMKHGFKIDEKDNDNLTPLYTAAEHDQFEFADFLIEEGADVFASNDGTTFLHIAASRGSSTAIIYFLDIGIDIEAPNDYEYIPLYFAAKAGKCDAIKVLTNNGADLLTRDKDGNSLLHIAVEENDSVAVQTLINAGISVDITAGYWGLTPLHICAVNQNMDLAQLLICNKANIYCKTHDGRTPLDIALKNNDADMVSFISSFEKLLIS
ncbi:putative ankyrin repeat protein RF_0381 isoform X2 [Halyomorpha halys]|nr:uncharacterized protein LOC106692867 isoform X2 [Halyomorpha halys]